VYLGPKSEVESCAQTTGLIFYEGRDYAHLGYARNGCTLGAAPSGAAPPGAAPPGAAPPGAAPIHAGLSAVQASLKGVLD